MNTDLLAEYEAQLADAVQLAADSEDPEPTSRFRSDLLLANTSITLRALRRTVHGIHDDASYARDKSGELVVAALVLHQYLLASAIECGSSVEAQGSGTGPAWCSLRIGHDEEHAANQNLTQLLAAAADLDFRAVQLTCRLRQVLLRDGKHAPEALDAIAEALVDIGGELRASVEDYRAQHG